MMPIYEKCIYSISIYFHGLRFAIEYAIPSYALVGAKKHLLPPAIVYPEFEFYDTLAFDTNHVIDAIAVWRECVRHSDQLYEINEDTIADRIETWRSEIIHIQAYSLPAYGAVIYVHGAIVRRCFTISEVPY